MSEWSPSSWKTKPAAQEVHYDCEADVETVIHEISKLPPLVTSW